MTSPSGIYIPNEYILFFLGAFLTLVGAVIRFFWKAVDTLKTGFDEVKDILSRKEVSDDYRAKECDSRHQYITGKLKNHEERIQKIEKHELFNRAMEGKNA